MTVSNVLPINAVAAAHLAGDVTLPTPAVLDTPHRDLAELARLQATRLLDDDDYEPVMARLGVGKRRVQQLLKELRDGTPAATPERFELTDHHKATIVACKGNVSLAYRELERAGHELPDQSVFWRRWHDELKAHQHYARRGAEGFLDNRLYLPYEAPHRNAVWQADHFELPVDVVADGCTTTLVKPWLTLFEDDRTRMPMGWHLVAEPNRRPDAEVVVATLADAIRIRNVDGVDVGGVPGVVRWDNDKSFLAGMVTQLAGAVGFEAHAVPPRSGYMKGKVERLGQTIETQFCALQPRFTHAGTTLAGRNVTREETPLTAIELRRRLDLWFTDYSHRDHSTLGMSPFEAWTLDAEPLRQARDADLRSALLVDTRRRKVQKKGVFFDNRYWASAEVLRAVGRKATVRYPVGLDIDFIEVYGDDGRWIGTAWPARHLGAEQRRRVGDANREAYREIRRLQDAAADMRAAANDVMDFTDATPSVAAVAVADPVAADADDLYDLLNPPTHEPEEG